MPFLKLSTNVTIDQSPIRTTAQRTFTTTRQRDRQTGTLCDGRTDRRQSYGIRRQ